MTARDEILKLLEANKGTLADNLDEIFARNAEDFISVGVDPREVAGALIHLGMYHLIAMQGLPDAVSSLRRRADVLEKIGAQFCQRQARH